MMILVVFIDSVRSSIYTSKYSRFRQLLIDYRSSKNITQAELAKLLKKPQSFISKYERGERRLDFVEFLEVAHALDIDIVSFISKLNNKSEL